MGYTTDFSGGLTITPALSKEQSDFINAFSASRRMGRDPHVIMQTEKGKHGRVRSNVIPPEVNELVLKINELGYTAKLTKMIPDWKTLNPVEIYGEFGEYYVGDNDRLGVKDYNTPPGKKSYGDDSNVGQPGLWCQWVVRDDDTLVWDGGEKFYAYVEWLEYLIENFFKDWGVLLNGEIEWQGEEMSDRGQIVVKDNVVETYEVTYKKITKKNKK